MQQGAMTRRRFLSGAVVGTVGVALAACAPTPAPVVEVPAEGTPAAAPTEKVKLTYGTFAEATQLAAMTEITNLFAERHPEYEVQIQAKPWGQYWESLTVQAAGGSTPDVSWITPNYALHFVKGDRLADVTDLIERDQINLADYVGENMESRFQGRYYGMPYGNGAMVWAYNKDLFDEAGLSYPTADWSWVEVRDAAKALTKEENGQRVVWGLEIGTWWEHYAAIPLGNRISQYSGGVFTDDGGWFDTSKPITCTMNDPKMVEAMTWIEENICREGIQPRPGEITLAPGIDSAFEGGIIAMGPCGTWEISSRRRVQFNWDLCLAPKSPITGERRTTSYSLPHSIFKTTTQLEGAWQLIKWHAGEEAQNLMAINGAKEPMLKSSFDKLSGEPPSFAEILKEHYFNFNWNMSTMVFDGQPEAESQISSMLDYMWMCERKYAELGPEIERTVNAVLAEKQPG